MLRRPRLSRQYLCWDFPHYTSPKAERRVGGLPQDKASPRPAVELYHSAPRTQSVGICASDLKYYLGAPLILARRPPQRLLPSPRNPRPRGRRRKSKREIRFGIRRPSRLRTDRALPTMSRLPPRPILDVPSPRYPRRAPEPALLSHRHRHARQRTVANGSNSHPSPAAGKFPRGD